MELKKVVIKYRKEHCDKSGNLVKSNLSKTQQDDLKKFKTRIQKEDLVCGETDKTGKFTLDTRVSQKT